MDKKVIVSMTIIFILVSNSVFARSNMNYDNESQVIALATLETTTKINTIDTVIVPNIMNKIELSNYIKLRARFNDENTRFLIDLCEDKNLNIFTIMAVMKVESDFRHKVVGRSGEIGIGQLMDDTARLTAKRLNIDYKREYLYDVRYNVNIFTEHLKYLENKYDNDIHKMLTAYNRGRGGLRKHMASRAGEKRPQESSYSRKVVKFINVYSNEFKTISQKTNE
ncbi:lytic transglycosylase domain-containing protein [Clostridiaceae bacterium M8S5]|nr:lytic transglycosylase domain-containing protein [Clostridiaceae bacterium M8S5]